MLEKQARVFIESTVILFVQQELEIEPAGVSGTVTISDHKSYIKTESFRGRTPTEIHSASNEVCGEFTVDRSMVSRWANRFRGGSLSIDNDSRSGRLRTSTGERTLKLVADTLEEDRRTT